MTTLTERIRNGSGEDRELDWEIHKLFWPGGPDIPLEAPELTPHFTSDLNAVFALVERELPGKQWAYHFNPGDGYICQFPPIAVAWHKDRCRAILLALLAAKEPRP